MDTRVTANAKLAVEHLAKRVGQLYSLPAVALEVLELTQQPQVDIRALKECIENDPALTGKVLRVVNSALFGLSREVSDLNHALTLLGVKPLKLLVLGFSLSDAIFSRLSGRCIERYWRHTLTKAVAARELSESLWRIPGDDAFLVALLQDLGLLVLLQDLGESFADFLERVWLADGDLLRLERESLGFDHRELTARLLANWGLPSVLVSGILADRNEQEFADKLPAQQALPHVLRLAELMADLLAERRPRALERLLAAEAHLSLSHEQLHALTGRLQTKVHALADVFSLHLPEGQDYRDVLAEAHSRLSSVAEEAAEELISGRSRRVHEIDTELERSLLSQAVELTAEMRRSLAQSAANLTEGAEPEATPVARPQPRTPKPAPAPKVKAATRNENPDVVDGSLDNDPMLMELLSTAVAACRHSRAPLSLALVEIDQFARIEREQGQLQARQIVQRVGAACSELGGSAGLCRQVRPTRFAIVLPGWDRHEASEFHQLLQLALQDVVIEEADGRYSPIRLSVGLAAVTLPPKNFEPLSLLESATRCLGAVRRSGGATLKSIGIY
jgi:HD-like signal output (HDOD) protein/GGDEF domain-containing protein